MATRRIGIIGGSGFYVIPGLKLRESVQLSTPFGDPSDELGIAEAGDKELVFLPRHGRGHRVTPSEVNYRANIHALKQLGVEWIISISAVGSFKQEIKPLDVVLVDQFIDLAVRRSNSFFGDGLAAHIAFAEPICQNLRRSLFEAGQEQGVGGRIHWGGTYLNIEGPAFSTKAESVLHQSWGCSVVGMTNATEAKLAREAEICYATMAVVTDYDSWISDEKTSVHASLVLDNLKKNVATAQKIVMSAVKNIVFDAPCACHSALKDAMLTQPDSIPAGARARLDLLIRKYIR
jgi:5'-methylthioadenosine phosphorylase